MPAPEAHYTQTNNYLDDARRSLRQAKIMLRAREITFPVGMAKGLGKPPVTIAAKRRRSVDNGLFINEERQQVMHIDDWRDIEYGKAQLEMKGPVFTWLLEQVPDLGKLRILGHTENIRWQIYSDMFMLELDKTIFPDWRNRGRGRGRDVDARGGEEDTCSSSSPNTASRPSPRRRASTRASWRKPKVSATTAAKTRARRSLDGGTPMIVATWQM